MSTVVIIILIGVVVWMFWPRKRTPDKSSSEQPASSIEISVSRSGSPGRQGTEDIGALTAAGEGAWTLNPNSPLPVTVTGASRELASELRELLNTATSWSYKLPEIAYLIARHNVRFKEVDEFVAQNKARFSAEVQRLMKESSEWAGASDKDKLDLLGEFREKAIASLGVQTGNADLTTLLTGEPKSLTHDDALLERFSGDSALYSFYLSQLGRANSVVLVKADDYFRKSWETLVDKGLALRGKDIPKQDLLAGLRLKDLNAMLAGAIPKPLGRKAKAVEACLALPDLDSRLGQQISYRETFQVVAPQGMDVSALAESFAYANTLAEVVQITFFTGTRTLQALREKKEAGPGVYDAWEVTNWNEPVPACAQQYVKKYGRLPAKRPPYHVGCDCTLECSFKDD